MAAFAIAGMLGAALIVTVPCCMRRGAGLTARSVTSRFAARLMSSTSEDGARTRKGQYIDCVDTAAAALRAGHLVAFPTETVYGLGAHAFDADAVARIFTVKGRPRSDPLIVHVASAKAAEPLIRIDGASLALMRRLMADFWPGPLTLVAPACPELPAAVTAGTGFVGVRLPAHGRAVDLLRAAAVPVAAPSANRFGHVSPTRPEHVMDDLGDHDIFVLTPEAQDQVESPCCNVGIESTVLKVDAEARELLLLRRGGVPEAALKRWLDGAHSDYTFRVKPPKHAAPLPLAQSAGSAESTEASEQPGMQAPGMTLTHYAPDLPSFLLSLAPPAPTPTPSAPCASPSTPGAPPSFSVVSAVVLDFGGRLAHLRASAVAYRDLSPSASPSEAAARVFEALRWAEGHATAKCVLLPTVDAPCTDATEMEHVPALADRLFRAASGRSARLVDSGTGTGASIAVVQDDDE